MRQKASLTTMKTDEPMKYTMLTAAEALASTEDTATPQSETLRLPLKNLVRLLPDLSRCDKKNLTS